MTNQAYTSTSRPQTSDYMDEGEAEDSPYPEVRASVSNTDDTEMPALTFRVWLIGLHLCMVGGAMNLFFNFRYPAPYISPLVLLYVYLLLLCS